VFRAAIPSLPGTFVLKTGSPTIYTKTGSSGRNASTPSARNVARQSMPRRPSHRFLDCGVGGIDQRQQLAPPARQQWCRSALPWSMNLTNVEQVERQ
jgi:hypothetical protein